MSTAETKSDIWRRASRKWRRKNMGYCAAKQREWYHSHLDHARELARKSRLKGKERNWAGRAVSRCKTRAKAKNLPFDLELSDLLPLPELCPVCGCRLEYTGCQDQPRWNWASVDRIKPKVGYVKGNVRVMCYAENAGKLDGARDVVTRRRQAKRKEVQSQQESLFDAV